jgi:hypothetical protein
MTEAMTTELRSALRLKSIGGRTHVS